jgi:hypothetical protein
MTDNGPKYLIVSIILERRRARGAGFSRLFWNGECSHGKLFNDKLS